MFNSLQNNYKSEYITGFIHNSSLVTSYNLTKAPPNKWESKIYHTAPSTTLEQCAALCQLNVVRDELYKNMSSQKTDSQ